MIFKFKIWDSIKQSWPIYKENFGVLILLTAVTAIVNAFSQENGFGPAVLSFAISFLLVFVWIKYTLCLIDKKGYDFFSKKTFPTLLQYWNVLKTSVLFFIIFIVSLPFLLLPAFYFSGRLAFALYLSIEKNQGAIDSLSDSWVMTKKNGWRLFWKNLLIGLFMISGFIFFGVGVLFTFPVGYLVMSRMYRAYQSQSQIKDEKKDIREESDKSEDEAQEIEVNN